MKLDDQVLMAFADNELTPEKKAQVETALRSDPRARARVAMFRVSARMARFAAAERLIEPGANPMRYALLLSHGARRRLMRFVVLACVACCALGVSAVYVLNAGPTAVESLIGEVAEYHAVFALETDHLVEVNAEHTEELSVWLGQRLDRLLSPPDLRWVGLTFAGGRMLVVDGKPVADLLYTRQGQKPVALCIVRFGSNDGLRRTDERNGLRVVSAFDGQFAYLLVGDMTASEAEQAAGAAFDQL